MVSGTYVTLSLFYVAGLYFDFPDPEYVDALLAKVLWSISVGERSLYFISGP